MKKLIFLFIMLGVHPFLRGQISENQHVLQDSLWSENLEEIILISNSLDSYLKDAKALGSLDSYLEESNSVNMIKRGAYAWEPMLNGMTTDRSIITIDGMRVYAACTDRMDPITSYVENTNFSKARISEGQSGATHGGTIAGSIDLERRKSGFNALKKFSGSAFSGFETNNQQQTYGTTLSYSANRFFTDIDFIYRDAKNYKAGHRSGKSSEVDFSPFTKYNFSAITGYKINDQHQLEASAIYDRATDVGYPGLPMDVSLARAFIGSLQYNYRNPWKYINLWETKAYFNTVTHVMDDSHRPDVPIRMDMPGWSKTQGIYSKFVGSQGHHRYKITLSGHRNNSLAEMTMFPNDPNESDMFMLTWPDVNTVYGGIELEDQIHLNHHLELGISAGIGLHHNKIRSEFGLSSLQIFYPDLESSKNRILKSFQSSLSWHSGDFTHKFGLGYGERAPTISEAYGFYLLNTNDNYDYVGNPNLHNEKSLNISLSSVLEKKDFKIKAQVNYFHIMDYIIGKPRPGIPSMNMTAEGIKVYEQLDYAHMFNAAMDFTYFIAPKWIFMADASYRYGQGGEGTRLPLIQPFTYGAKLRYDQQDFFGEISIQGSTKNRNSIEFGEIQKPGYLITNLALSKDFKISRQNLIAKVGVENLFDRYYTTFEDWFGIPRMGRNVYANLIFKW